MMSTAELKRIAEAVMRAALEAADPAEAVRRHMRPAWRPPTGRVFLISVGKAAASMAAGALDIVGGVVHEGIVVLPHGYGCDLERVGSRITAYACGHPIPDERGLEASRLAAVMIDGMAENDLCLFLLSGGGSSLLPMPFPPVSLADKMETTSLLLRSGADIRQINTVRKHLSAIKGGRLGQRCRGKLLTLVISDVVGDALEFIGSGPTVADSTTYSDALAVLERFGLLDAVPAAVKRLILDGVAGQIPETPKRLPERHTAAIIAGNESAVDAAAGTAASLGFAPLILTTSLSGEAREVGRIFALISRESKAKARPIPPPACIIAGGETTVTVKGNGRGGRNQEIALAAALALEGAPGILLVSFATDGKEGETDSAGAFASGETISRAERSGLDPRACLMDNNSHAFLAAAGELITTGPTGTNVNDITFALVS